MHAVAVAEATTTMGGLELGGAKAAVPENKRGASKIASLRAAADLDGAADGGEEPCPASTSSSSHPADPTLETCCHEPPPIALNPLNSWLFFGEKALRLPIPPTNDIVLIQRTVLQELGFPDANADTLAKRFRDARMPNRAAWFRRLAPLSWKMYSRASELALPGMFRYLDARVRFFDGAVERALNAGVDQHLFLAAGYDTRAVRMATSEAAARLTAAKMRRQQKGGSGNGSGRGARASVASGGGDSAKVLGRASVKGSAAATAAAAAVTSSPSSSTSPFAPRFFEVDLPHVSAAKRELVDSVLPDAERWPRPAFVGADLLDAAAALRALEAAGFDASASRPCLATLEGILMYLPPRSAREILRTVSTLLTPGSLLAFDFVVEECFATGGVGYEGASRGADGATTSSPPPAPSAAAKTCPATDSSTYEIVDVPKEAEIAFPTYGLVASSVAHHGEPFRSGFEHAPERHAALAASLGFKVQELLDAPKVVETFFSGKKCTGPVSDYMAMALWEKL